MPAKITVRNLDFYYGRTQALHDISLDIPERIVMALIGPSGCGKSTFLRTLNRMNDVIPATRVGGEVTIDGSDIYVPGTDVVDLRRRVGVPDSRRVAPCDGADGHRRRRRPGARRP